MATTAATLALRSRCLWKLSPLHIPLRIAPSRSLHSSSAAMDGSIRTSQPPQGVHNAWIGAKGPGSLDLRSDVMTTPTPSMLAAVQSCTLLDDVFREDPTTIDLEAHVAALAGKEAGLFVLSGTMGNQLALRSLLVQPPYGVLCDHRSHIVKYEAGGVSSLTGATVKPIVPDNGIHLTLEDVMANVVLSDDVHACPTRVISLENTLNGMIMPLVEVERIAKFARQHGIKLHCDGARLWEAVVAGAGTLPDFCSHFDTVSLCFSKGLGAPVGSMLVGTEETLKHARWVRKSIGGGLRQPGVVTAAARVAVDETFGRAPDGSDGLLRESHAMAKKVEHLWQEMGGTLVHPAHTNMCWLDLEAAGCSEDRFVLLSEEAGLKVMGGRLVTHYQVAQNCDEVLKRLRQVFQKAFAEQEKRVSKVGERSMYKS
ncbi:Low-specificity L-threonine aldolase [Purpureocillium takamizusanense]|uniref:Low-specificity L-threonine aldolase n=1 Tax=Purpureocillium takamizusanense TaxID=2060973 RepID=A0A9Q8VFH8_9HYPO|nr:Low-specificity L-threonine aldolase [Purpureocillium takamizusanense]UNI25055.1 Low-specificity L-threonine aldolase [Purpureocillium takamizusanense]